MTGSHVQLKEFGRRRHSQFLFPMTLPKVAACDGELCFVSLVVRQVQRRMSDTSSHAIMVRKG